MTQPGPRRCLLVGDSDSIPINNRTSEPSPKGWRRFSDLVTRSASCMPEYQELSQDASHRRVRTNRTVRLDTPRTASQAKSYPSKTSFSSLLTSNPTAFAFTNQGTPLERAVYKKKPYYYRAQPHGLGSIRHPCAPLLNQS